MRLAAWVVVRRSRCVVLYEVALQQRHLCEKERELLGERVGASVRVARCSEAKDRTSEIGAAALSRVSALTRPYAAVRTHTMDAHALKELKARALDSKKRKRVRPNALKPETATPDDLEEGEIDDSAVTASNAGAGRVATTTATAAPLPPAPVLARSAAAAAANPPPIPTPTSSRTPSSSSSARSSSAVLS